MKASYGMQSGTRIRPAVRFLARVREGDGGLASGRLSRGLERVLGGFNGERGGRSGVLGLRALHLKRAHHALGEMRGAVRRLDEAEQDVGPCFNFGVMVLWPPAGIAQATPLNFTQSGMAALGVARIFCVSTIVLPWSREMSWSSWSSLPAFLNVIVWKPGAAWPSVANAWSIAVIVSGLAAADWAGAAVGGAAFGASVAVLFGVSFFPPHAAKARARASALSAAMAVIRVVGGHSRWFERHLRRRCDQSGVVRCGR